ncbi:hypothetical protein [Paraburkholderia sp.]|uniref:hypothetical protein n=1 Tax=Paraburkholderia sp. TaxID=1926495 RepID=UPI003C7CE484
MKRIYDHLGFEVEVSAKTHLGVANASTSRYGPGYLAIVTIWKAGGPVSCFTPVRLGKADGRPLRNEADALMGGFSAGRRLINDQGHNDRG